jgi:hypothetical protein
LLFQTLDNKKDCYAIYYNDAVHQNYELLGLDKTWAYTPHVEKRDLECAQIWCEGRTLAEACPDEKKEEWQSVVDYGKSFLRSFNHAKINLEDICFYDLVPKKFLLDYCRIKNQISEFVFENYKKPKNYDFMLNLAELTYDISCQSLNIDDSCLLDSNPGARNFKKKLRRSKSSVAYNIWGSTTGRLTTATESFPILTLKKEYREVLKPNNDWFVELDFNAAELRTFLALQGIEQPKEDIHNWIVKNIFNGKLTREQAKKKIFSWLYNPRASNKKFEKLFDKQSIMKYYSDGKVYTPFDREIEVGKDKALNYTIQSATSDLFLRQVLGMRAALENRKSYIAFCIHDSVIIDFSDDDRDLLKGVIHDFSNTKLGKYKVNISAGKDFLNMKRMDIKCQ